VEDLQPLKKKLEIVQLWRCSILQARIHTRARGTSQQNVSDPDDTVGPDRLQHRILAGGVDEAQRENQPQRSGSTITTWLHEYKDHCSYARAFARPGPRIWQAL
jgi:hypothetical protein